jgi:LEA14-like dessication related protein
MAVVLLAVVAGCSRPVAPEFKSVGNLELEMDGLSTARLTGSAYFYNPNKNSIYIRDVDIDVYLDSDKVAAIQKTIDVTAAGFSDFAVPLSIDVALKDLKLNSIGAVLELFSSRERKLRYLGKVRVKAHGIPFSVPVDYTETIELSL